MPELAHDFLHLRDRAQILPERELPDPAQLLAEGQRLAQTVTVGPCL